MCIRDRNWMDKRARSTVEMNDPASRPAIASQRDNMAEYDVVFVGFPIWWYVAPTIISTFLESGDFSGKKVVPFATSGSSGMGKTLAGLKAVCPEASWVEGKMVNGLSDRALSDWAKGV